MSLLNILNIIGKFTVPCYGLFSITNTLYDVSGLLEVINNLFDIILF